MRRLLPTILAACLLVLALVPAALAGPPPKGKYGCTIPATGFAGNLLILDRSHYRLDNSKKGLYVSQGKSLKFKSGAFHGVVRGRWSFKSGHRAEIALTSLRSGVEQEYCDKEG
ncbi:MAG: hypothetical protein NVS2B6_13750 [Thermoleophilaceae bacterium]